LIHGYLFAYDPGQACQKNDVEKQANRARRLSRRHEPRGNMETSQMIFTRGSKQMEPGVSPLAEELSDPLVIDLQHDENASLVL